MAFTIERIANEPIVVLTVSYPIDDPAQEAIESDAAVAALGEEIGGKYYRIAEMSGMELTWDNVVYWLAEQKKANRGSINDPNVVSYLVSDTAMTQKTAKFAHQPQYGGREIKIFRTLDDALEHARKGEELADIVTE